ncbi:MAG: dihydroorotate oxidase, partial [Saprospiraceae bacterium]|nr:dihydroorotate oxidase [Saprospiraceae bacterium]
LNLSCPNVPGKPQTAYDFEQTERVLEAVSKFDKHPLGVKLPPYFDLIHFEAMANILNRYPIQFVTCINSIGNALIIDPQEERVVIRPKDGFGGLGGDYIKPTALANVRQFYLRLRDDIQVIACGGVKNAWDAFEHILCGAAAVQIGTQLMREGGECFGRLSAELKQIMQDKGYQSLSDFRGKLKTV